MTGNGRMVSGIYGLGAEERRGDPASVRLLARKFWHERGGAMLTPEEMDCLSERARREIEAVMVARHGKRLGARKVGT